VPLARERRLIAMPRFADLSSTAQDALWAADTLADRLGGAAEDLERSLPPPKAPVRAIHHPLSPLFPCPAAPLDLAAARLERRIRDSSSAMLHDALHANPPGELCAALMRVAKAITGDDRLRERARCASPDRFGRYVVYAAPLSIPGQLATIEAALRRPDLRPRAFDMMVALVAITNCHPLLDGNGRLARIVGNWLLAPVQRPAGSIYLPLREIGAYARGGYLLRVRQAEIQEDWEPLACFLRAALELWGSFLCGTSKEEGKTWNP
jgi:hypothetical protein